MILNELRRFSIILIVACVNIIFVRDIHANPTAPQNGSFTDARDGQHYRTVRIGGHTWMAENLNFVTGDSYCLDDDPANCMKYGRLYTWHAAMNACPAGWRLPDTAAWSDLSRQAGGPRTSAINLKAQSGWNNTPIINPTDVTVRGHTVATSGSQQRGHGADIFGFRALPGEYRHYSRTLDVLDRAAAGAVVGAAGQQANPNICRVGCFAYWWSATERARRPRDVERNRDRGAYCGRMSHSVTGLGISAADKRFAYSVRCVQDDGVQNVHIEHVSAPAPIHAPQVVQDIQPAQVAQAPQVIANDLTATTTTTTAPPALPPRARSEKPRLVLQPISGAADGEGEAIVMLFSIQDKLRATFDLVSDADAEYTFVGRIRDLGGRSLFTAALVHTETSRLAGGSYRFFENIEEIIDIIPVVADDLADAARRDVLQLPSLIAAPFGETDELKTLAQIFPIVMANAGRYAMLPPRASVVQNALDELQSVVPNHQAEDRVLAIAAATNADYVLLSEARTLGTMNMLVMQIYNAMYGVQIIGESLNFRTLDNALEQLPQIVERLTSNAPAPAPVAAQVAPPSDPTITIPPIQTALDPQQPQQDSQDELRRALGPVTTAPVSFIDAQQNSFSGGARFGTWLLNTAILPFAPLGIGSYAVMGDWQGGLAQTSIVGSGMAAFGMSLALTQDYDLFPLLAVPTYLGWQIYNVYRAATYNRPVTRGRRYDPKEGMLVGYRIAYNVSEAFVDVYYPCMSGNSWECNYYTNGGAGVEFGVALSNPLSRYWSFRYGGNLVIRTPISSDEDYYYSSSRDRPRGLTVREVAVVAPALLRVGGNDPSFHIFMESGFQLELAFVEDNDRIGRNPLNIGWVLGYGFYLGRHVEIGNRLIFGINEYSRYGDGVLIQYNLGLTIYPGGR